MKVALLGLPGAGKTSLGRRLSSLLSIPCIDVDDDILEPTWGCTVAEKLAKVGDQKFLQAEEEALLEAGLPKEDGILACTGSNCLGDRAMQRLESEGWLFVWIDVHPDDVLARLKCMKVSRIVGQTSSPMADVLQARIPSYRRWHHARVLAGRGWDLDTLEKELVRVVERLRTGTEGSLSTTRGSGVHSLDSAILGGLAPCGGLYLPSRLPDSFTLLQLGRMLGSSYTDVAEIVLAKLFHPKEFPPSQIQDIVNQAYSNFEHSAVVPVTQLEEGLYLSELFHGPTGSFKDLALQLTPQLVARALEKTDDRSLVLVATSGDTGSAVLEGFGKFGGSKLGVLVMFPTRGISDVQRQQMVSCAAHNVKVVGVEGDFDDCQRLVKSMFAEQELKTFIGGQYGVNLNTANSINWGRLVPQVAYHFHAYLQLVDQGRIKLGDQVDLAVPCGNMGNMVSALLARSMGLPFGKMIIACNSNNVLADFFRTGVYDLRERKLACTISPAIDILVSSNLERWLCLQLGPKRVAELYNDLATNKVFRLSDDERKLACPSYIEADWCSEEDCKVEVVNCLTSTDYLLDPHTAVAVAVARRCGTPQVPMLVLSTAHYSKFWNDLEPLVPFGQAEVKRPSVHNGIRSCLKKPVVHRTVLEPKREPLIELIKDFVAQLFSPVI